MVSQSSVCLSNQHEHFILNILIKDWLKFMQCFFYENFMVINREKLYYCAQNPRNLRVYIRQRLTLNKQILFLFMSNWRKDVREPWHLYEENIWYTKVSCFPTDSINKSGKRANKQKTSGNNTKTTKKTKTHGLLHCSNLSQKFWVFKR